MIRVFIVFTICGWTLTSAAQTARQSLIPSYIKTGAYSNKQTDVFSFSENQAALTRIKTFSAGAFSERRFMIDELDFFSAALALPTHTGNFGLQLHHFGNSIYSETQGGLAYGKKLNDYLDVGVQFNYYTMHISGYGNAAAINFDAGLIFHFTEQLHGGIHVYNPTSSRLGKFNEEKLPAEYSIGLGYDASENFFISTEIEKIEDLALNVNTSLQYKFADRFFARCGIATATPLIFFGVGVTMKDFRIDIAASIHPQLGVTPGLLLLYTKSSKE